MELVVLENDYPVFNPHLQELEPFKSIVSRDKSKKKQKAIKELAYIYFKANYASPIFNIEEDRREKELRRLTALPDNWEADELIEKAINTYKELQKTPTIRALEELRESMHSTASVIKVLREQLNTLIKQSNESESGKSSGLGAAVKLLSDINKIANDFPSLTKSLEEVELKVKREVESKTGRKKQQVGILEDRNQANVY